LADEPNKLRAEIRARQAEDGRKAMAEYEANAAAVRVKTEKLRALRLAREAAEQAAPAAVKPKAGKSAKKSAGAKSATTKPASKKKKAPAGKLSDWLEDQAGSGRNT
jgi:hypothetical protein